MRAARALLPVATALLGGCWVALDLDDKEFSLVPGDTGGGGAGGGSTTTTGGRDGMVAVSPPGHDPYLIDSTEVTVAAYDAWLKTSPSTDGQRSTCSWNTSFVPGECDPNGSCGCSGSGITLEGELLKSAKLPVRCIDFCDAVAFCEGQGKHLCGGLDDVVLEGAPPASNDPNLSEWYYACSNGAAAITIEPVSVQTFPYGGTFTLGACVDSSIDFSGPHDTGTPTCSGGIPGIYDMSGNVEEWVDHCYGTEPPGSGTACFRPGGAFWNAEPDQLDCDLWWEQSTDIRDQSPSTGFRCCDDP
ncbi:MAG: SUMF1/EgtB/PvdO family nonheme iron enzyme [Myxococcales bacterium]|nr:SUMF1/EgtB/PvdO family nonheme iron enzyme [Myxococcales bacterium]